MVPPLIAEIALLFVTAPRRAATAHPVLGRAGSPATWDVLCDAGVDLINSDDLPGLRAFLLLMGVPVVTLAGDVAVRRAGASILSNARLPELIAPTPAAYVETAAALAADVQRLANLRSNMRERMMASPLTDLPSFVRDLESAYRTMWRASIQ